MESQKLGEVREAGVTGQGHRLVAANLGGGRALDREGGGGAGLAPSAGLRGQGGSFLTPFLLNKIPVL